MLILNYQTGRSDQFNLDQDEFRMQSEVNLESQQSRWLTGTEYYNIISELSLMVKKGKEKLSKIPIFSAGEHPQDIYFKPSHLMYALVVESPAFVHFPKLASGSQKQITWKRQNFETNLPKNEPIVAYIGAIGQMRGDFDNCYKMHIVWRCQDQRKHLNQETMVVLCQIRPFSKSKETWEMANKENITPSLPAPGKELDEYLMKIGEEINRKRKEESLQAKAKEEEENELKCEGKIL